MALHYSGGIQGTLVLCHNGEIGFMHIHHGSITKNIYLYMYQIYWRLFQPAVRRHGIHAGSRNSFIKFNRISQCRGRTTPAPPTVFALQISIIPTRREKFVFSTKTLVSRVPCWWSFVREVFHLIYTSRQTASLEKWLLGERLGWTPLNNHMQSQSYANRW